MGRDTVAPVSGRSSGGDGLRGRCRYWSRAFGGWSPAAGSSVRDADGECRGVRGCSVGVARSATGPLGAGAVEAVPALPGQATGQQRRTGRVVVCCRRVHAKAPRQLRSGLTEAASSRPAHLVLLRMATLALTGRSTNFGSGVQMRFGPAGVRSRPRILPPGSCEVNAEISTIVA